MAHVITFRSAGFDPSRERPNPINPIAGEGVLRWLREKLRESRYETTEPAPEDWGWYLDVAVDDPLSTLIERLVRQEPDAVGVEVEREA